MTFPIRSRMEITMSIRLRKTLTPHRGTNMESLDELFLQRPAEFSEGIGETEISMKNNQKNIHSRSRLSRLRIAAAGTLVLAAAGLAATSMRPPKLPWAVPTVTVGNSPGTAAVDQAT